MQRFWETIIEPVIETVQPRRIVEVGSDAGGNTKNLLEFCRRSGAQLHVIDPLPKYDVDEWQERYGDHLVFHKALSLDALPRIDEPDIVLIDGDHNWYTVFNELKLIEKRCEDLSISFPLVMLHDIGWPYGRRDLYYDPDTIPEEHRKSYEKRGLRPGLVELAEKGGLNPHLYNAIRENEPRSGVLTAVEDFLIETKYDLDLLKVPSLNGLGILVPVTLRERNTRLAEFLQVFELPEFVARFVERVELDRMEIQIDRQEQRAVLRKLRSWCERKVRELSEESIAKDDEIATLHRRLGDSSDHGPTERETR